MSDSSEAKRERRAREAALATTAGENGLWNLADIKSRVEAGVEVPTGAKFQFTNLRDILDAGLGGGGSPVESMGIEQYLAANNLTPQQFQQQFGGLPFVFNDDGTATYDPSAQRQAFEYTPASYDRNLKIGLGLMAALAGAGFTGLGQGGAVAGAEAGAGGGAAAGFGETAAFGAGDVASLGSLTSSELATALGSGIAEGSLATAAGLGSELAAGAGYVGDVGAMAGIDAAYSAAPSLAVGESLWPSELAGTMEAGAIGDVAAGADLALGADAVGAELAGLDAADLAASFDANSFGVNSLNSFDTGEMSQVLDRAPAINTSGMPGGSVLPDVQSPAPVIDKSFSAGANDSFMGKLLSQGTLDKVLKYGPAIVGGLGAVSQRNATKSAVEKIGNLGGTTRAVGENITQGFLNGTLNPADLAGIDKWERDSIAASRQFFARAGTSRSTQATTAEQEITKKAEEMRAQARQNLLATGINALGVADKYQAAAIEAEMQGDAQMNQYLTNFMNAYGSWMRALPTLTGAKP